MRLRIGHLSTTYHTSLVLIGASWEGDLKLEWELYPAGPAIIKDLAEGAIDIGYIGLPPAMIGIDRGAGIRCIAGGHVEGSLIVGRRGYASLQEKGNVKEVLSQFAGSTIGSPARGSIHDVILRDLLRKAGLEDEILVKNYPWSDHIVEALERGEIEGAVGTPSLAGVALESRAGEIVVPPSELWPYNPSYGIVVREELIQESPGAIEGFLRLHKKASTLIRESPSVAARIVSRVLDVVDEKFVLMVYGISPRYCSSLSKEFVQATMAFVEVLLDLGYISRPLLEEEIFYRGFIDRLHPEPPHY
jgi:NitT/TauT family transport system substrate-binding protein